MVTGIEAAGLALAIFPVVIEVVEWYNGLLSSRDIRLLLESLKNNRQIFLNTLQEMLRSVVSPTELSSLMSDIGGDAWKARQLNDRVIEHLGSEAQCILENVADIHRTIAELQKKVPLRSAAASDKSLVARAKLIIKCFVHGPHYKSSLERLRIRIREFGTLVEGTLKLAPLRNASSDHVRNLELIRDCADCLHASFQAGWKCACDELHPTNMQLEIWSSRSVSNQDGANRVDYDFSFLCAHTVQAAQPDHWMKAEITVSKASSSGCADRTITNISGAAVSVVPPSPAVVHVNSPSGSGSSTAGAQKSRSTAPDNTCNLCDVVNGTKTHAGHHRRSLNSVSGMNGHLYQLFIRPDPVAAARTKRSLKLADILQQRSALSNKSRMQLALMLAWGVLQISTTSWLKGQWTKDNVLLLMDDTNKPIPYISHAFKSSRHASRSSTLAPTVPNRVGEWIRNTSLFALGVFLLELCYSRSIEDLAAPQEKDSRGQPCDYTPFLTAMRLAKTVQDEMGLHYAQAVNACFTCPSIDTDAEGKPIDPSTFTNSIMNNIIEPLTTTAGFYGN